LRQVLNGGFGTPVVAYDLPGAALGFNGTTLEGLRATGRLQVRHRQDDRSDLGACPAHHRA
jgi:hypothetical protein